MGFKLLPLEISPMRDSEYLDSSRVLKPISLSPFYSWSNNKLLKINQSKDNRVLVLVKLKDKWCNMTSIISDDLIILKQLYFVNEGSIPKS